MRQQWGSGGHQLPKQRHTSQSSLNHSCTSSKITIRQRVYHREQVPGSIAAMFMAAMFSWETEKAFHR